MDDAYICQECGAVVPHYNTPHDYKDCQIVKLRKRLEAALELLRNTVSEPDVPYAMGRAWIDSRDAALAGKE